MERRLPGMFFCAKTLFAPKLVARSLSNLPSRAIHPERSDRAES
jgi:hypothetical protein